MVVYNCWTRSSRDVGGEAVHSGNEAANWADIYAGFLDWRISCSGCVGDFIWAGKEGFSLGILHSTRFTAHPHDVKRGLDTFVRIWRRRIDKSLGNISYLSLHIIPWPTSSHLPVQHPAQKIICSSLLACICLCYSYFRSIRITPFLTVQAWLDKSRPRYQGVWRLIQISRCDIISLSLIFAPVSNRVKLVQYKMKDCRCLFRTLSEWLPQVDKPYMFHELELLLLLRQIGVTVKHHVIPNDVVVRLGVLSDWDGRGIWRRWDFKHTVSVMWGSEWTFDTGRCRRCSSQRESDLEGKRNVRLEWYLRTWLWAIRQAGHYAISLVRCDGYGGLTCHKCYLV